MDASDVSKVHDTLIDSFPRTRQEKSSYVKEATQWYSEDERTN